MTATPVRRFWPPAASRRDNLFLLNKYDAAAKITEALPYVESVRLSRKLPGTLRIDIVECSDPAGIQQDGHCWLISPEGKLVDSPPRPQTAALWSWACP